MNRFMFRILKSLNRLSSLIVSYFFNSLDVKDLLSILKSNLDNVDFIIYKLNKDNLDMLLIINTKKYVIKSGVECFEGFYNDDIMLVNDGVCLSEKAMYMLSKVR